MNQSSSASRHDKTTMLFTLARQTNIRMPTQDEETIYAAFFVYENHVPIDTINEVLEQVHRKCHIHNIWLADTVSLDTLSEEDEEATVPPIDQSWQSPFVGQSVEEAFEFLATVPLDKSLNRTFVIGWDQALYEQKKWLVIYRVDDGGEVTSIPCAAQMCMTFIDSGTEFRWPEYLEEWCRYGKPIF